VSSALAIPSCMLKERQSNQLLHILKKLHG
jgi:hypothetical protein